MPVLALVDVKIKPESLDEFTSFIKEILPDTRSYDGNRGAWFYANQEDEANIVIAELWDSVEHHTRYVEWRTETGVMDRVESSLAAPANLRYLDEIDA